MVKLKLWESVMVIIIFGLPLTYAYATHRQSVAGNLTFRGIVFCNLGTPKTVISNFVTSRQIETPYLSPYGYPNDVPGGQKRVEDEKKRLGQKCINSFLAHMLSHDRWLWFFFVVRDRRGARLPRKLIQFPRQAAPWHA